MASARRRYADKDYERAAEAATEALKHNANDAEATNLNRDSTGLAHLSRAGVLGQQGNYVAGIVELNAGLAVLPENASVKELLADFTNREQQRVEAEKKRAAELAEAQRKRQQQIAEEERKRRELELARQQRQERLNRLNRVFEAASQNYENAAMFARNELTATNPVTGLAAAITNALAIGKPSFEVLQDSSSQSDTIVIKARHGISIGYRECLIVAGQVGKTETWILFKVIESENPPKLNLLGGLLRMTTTVTTTTNDPKVARERQEKFQQRIRVGISIVKARIQSAIAKNAIDGGVRRCECATVSTVNRARLPGGGDSTF